MMEVRCMIKEDVPQVAVMERECFSQPWNKLAFLDALKQKEYFYMVALQDDKVIGYCGMYHVMGEGNITHVAVREQYRGAGVGKKLLQDFMQNGNNLGVETYTLEVRVSNKNAIKLYESCGFVNEGLRKDFYAFPKEDAFIMWKR